MPPRSTARHGVPGSKPRMMSTPRAAKTIGPSRAGAAPPHTPGKAVGAPPTPKPVGFNQPKPVTAASRVGGAVGSTIKGGAGMVPKQAKSNMAIPVLVLLTFLLVALARIKATKGSSLASLDIPKALFGGFILTLMLMLLNMWNAKLATAFASLVFVGALLEFGPSVLGTLIPKGKSAIDPSTGQYQTGLALDQTTPTGKATSANIPAKRGTQLA